MQENWFHSASRTILLYMLEARLIAVTLYRNSHIPLFDCTGIKSSRLFVQIHIHRSHKFFLSSAEREMQYVKILKLALSSYTIFLVFNFHLNHLPYHKSLMVS